MCTLFTQIGVCVFVCVCLFVCVWNTELSAGRSLLSRADRCANPLSDIPLPPHIPQHPPSRSPSRWKASTEASNTQEVWSCRRETGRNNCTAEGWGSDQAACTEKRVEGGERLSCVTATPSNQSRTLHLSRAEGVSHAKKSLSAKRMRQQQKKNSDTRRSPLPRPPPDNSPYPAETPTTADSLWWASWSISEWVGVEMAGVNCAAIARRETMSGIYANCKQFLAHGRADSQHHLPDLWTTKAQARSSGVLFTWESRDARHRHKHTLARTMRWTEGVSKLCWVMVEWYKAYIEGFLSIQKDKASLISDLTLSAFKFYTHPIPWRLSIFINISWSTRNSNIKWLNLNTPWRWKTINKFVLNSLLSFKLFSSLWRRMLLASELL